jgi:hypothetical protein
MDTANKVDCIEKFKVRELYFYKDKSTPLRIYNIIYHENSRKYFFYIQKLSDDLIELKIFENKNTEDINDDETKEVSVLCFFKKISLSDLLKTECFLLLKERDKVFKFILELINKSSFNLIYDGENSSCKLIFISFYYDNQILTEVDMESCEIKNFFLEIKLLQQIENLDNSNKWFIQNFKNFYSTNIFGENVIEQRIINEADFLNQNKISNLLDIDDLVFLKSLPAFNFQNFKMEQIYSEIDDEFYDEYRQKFHLNCDGKKNLLFIFETNSDLLGAFSSPEMCSDEGYRIGKKTDCLINLSSKKFWLCNNTDKAIYNVKNSLPRFGEKDLEFMEVNCGGRTKKSLKLDLNSYGTYSDKVCELKTCHEIEVFTCNFID